MPDVTIVGAGMAGLTAALRLSERGFRVTLLEQDDHIGGKLGAFRDPKTGDYREHSYHMYLNWYNNFWKIVDQLGVFSELRALRRRLIDVALERIEASSFIHGMFWWKWMPGRRAGYRDFSMRHPDAKALLSREWAGR